MNVYTINRRAHGDKPGDESVTFVSEKPAEFDLDAIRGDWREPSRTRIPRRTDAAAPIWMAIVVILVVAFVAAVAGVFA